MRKQRYFIEDVPEGQLPESAKSIQGEWHGVWLDANTFFGLAQLHDYELVDLQGRATVTVLASPVDDTPAHKQAGKKAGALAAHGVTGSDSVEQAALKIARKFKHPNLEP